MSAMSSRAGDPVSEPRSLCAIPSASAERARAERAVSCGSDAGQGEDRTGSELQLVDVSRHRRVGCSEVKMRRPPRRDKDALVLVRPESDHLRSHILDGELDLDPFVSLRGVRGVVALVENVEPEACHRPLKQERKRPGGVEPSVPGGGRHEGLDVAISPDRARDRYLPPRFDVDPDEKQRAVAEALVDNDPAVLDSRHVWLTVDDRDLAS